MDQMAAEEQFKTEITSKSHGNLQTHGIAKFADLIPVFELWSLFDEIKYDETKEWWLACVFGFFSVLFDILPISNTTLTTAATTIS